MNFAVAQVNPLQKKRAAPARASTKAQKITTFLMFNHGAEEAVNLYVSTFKNARILGLGHMDGPGGTMANATFELEGQRFIAMDGGPHFSFAQGMSLFVSCKTQDEIDHLWEGLSKGGQKSRCGWLTDKFGVSWQIVPETLGEMLSDAESGNAQAAMEAMLKMGKLDIKTLEKAYRS